VDIFGTLQRFVANFCTVKRWSVLLQLRRKSHWVFSSFGSIFLGYFSKAVGIRLCAVLIRFVQFVILTAQNRQLDQLFHHLHSKFSNFCDIRRATGSGGHGSGVSELIPGGFRVFFGPGSGPGVKIFFEKPDSDPDSLFNSGRSRSLRGHFLRKTIGTYRL